MKLNATTEVLASQFGSEVQELVQTLGFADLSESLTECAHLARQDFGRNFAAMAGPHSGEWAPRKQDGTGQKAGEGHPLEIKSGAMFLAETSDFGAGAITDIGTRDVLLAVDPDVIPYAAAQNYGYPEGNLPQRESFDVRDETADQMAELIADDMLLHLRE